MGWPSTFEDIEERRLESEVRRGFDGLIDRVRKKKSLDELRQEEENIEELSCRIVRYLEEKKLEALKAFNEATKLFKEPHVRIIRRLEKREKELAAVRERLATSESHLAKCRTKRIELGNKLKNTSLENAKLQKRIDHLTNQLAWHKEKETIKPLRQR